MVLCCNDETREGADFSAVSPAPNAVKWPCSCFEWLLIGYFFLVLHAAKNAEASLWLVC